MLSNVMYREPRLGRNAPCPCGSGKKYKRCHGARGSSDEDRALAGRTPSGLMQDGAGSASSGRMIIFICLALAAATLAIYAQTATHGYVAYDDDQYVYQNPWVKAGLTGSNVAWAFTTFFYANWHPLTWISYMLDSSLFGLSPGAQHLVNVAFHLASTLLLFLALARMTRQAWRSAVVAAIFAVHPMHVESVAWISERKDVLSTFFEMLTLLLYVRYVSRPSVRRYAAVAVAFGMSLLSKPMAVTFPFVLMLLDYWPLGRMDWPPKIADLRRLFLEKTPLLAMTAAASVLTFLAQRGYGAVVSLDRLPFTARVGNAVIGYVTYMARTLWPSDLAVLYPTQSSAVAGVLGALLILAALTGITLHWGKQRPYLAVGWFWFLGMLVPVIGLVQVGVQAMADRYTYVPMVGLSIAIVWTVGDMVEARRSLFWRNATVAATVVALGALAFAAHRQASYWKDSRTLFEHALAVTRDNHIIQNNLGVVAAGEGKSAEAAGLYRAALASAPDYAEAHANLGHELLKSGQFDKAESSLRKAADLKPDLANARADLGLVLAGRGEYEEARRHLERAVVLDPGNAESESNLCFVLTHLGRATEAIAHCNRALRINPSLATAKYNLGNALAAQKSGN